MRRLRAAGCVFAEEEAGLLLGAGGDVEDLVRRRVEGEPLEHVMGWARFCGLRIAVDAGVFVPRRRTEFLVRQAVGLAPPRAVVVDLCCGSGAVGAALAALCDVAELHAADVDPAAVRCARRNLGALGPVHEGDLYQPLPAALRGRVDVLAANVPYVPTGEIGLMPPEARLYEPRVALDGGPDGLRVLSRVAAGARDWLSPRGHLFFETSQRQAASAVDVLAGYGLTAETVFDHELGATVVVAKNAV